MAKKAGISKAYNGGKKGTYGVVGIRGEGPRANAHQVAVKMGGQPAGSFTLNNLKLKKRSK